MKNTIITNLFLIAITFICLAGCTSVAPGVEYSIAVTPFEDTKSYIAGRELLILDPAGQKESALQENLVIALRKLKVASEVYALDSANYDEAKQFEADLIIKPKLIGTTAAEDWDYSSKWVYSVLLWFTTWIGGLYVDDRNFESSLSVTFELINPNNGQRFDTRPYYTNNNNVELCFFERNKFFSWGTLTSLILPPFWTIQDDEETRKYLTIRCFMDISEQFKEELLADLPDIETLKEVSGEIPEVAISKN